MTIQISVVIWTIICFAALYLILKNLLFKPVLEVMDKRQEKIASAHEREEKARTAALEEKETRLKEIEAMKLEAEKESKAEIEKVRLEGKNQLENAKRERIEIVDKHFIKMEEEYAADLKKADRLLESKANDFIAHSLIG